MQQVVRTLHDPQRPIKKAQQPMARAYGSEQSLFLVNGGSAVAILAFLQAVWTSAPSLVPFVVGALISIAVSLPFVAWAHFNEW